MKKLTTDNFIKASKKVHGNKYIYSKTKYEHSLQKVIITCKDHGDFYIRPSNHLNNKQGCSKCGMESTNKARRGKFKDFYKKIKKKDNYYKYDFNNFKDVKSAIDKKCAICSEHGEYITSKKDILRSKVFDCPQCKINLRKKTQEDFLYQSSQKHGSKFDYSKTKYTKAHSEITITCKKHGDFQCKAYIHMAGGGFCPQCTNFISSHEIEIKDFLQQECGITNIIAPYRKIKGTRELDIFIPKFKIGIEVDGLYWHSDIFKEKNYHLDKYHLCKNKNIDLLSIFEDEWVNKKNICKSIIRNKINKTERRIFARKCRVVNLSSEQARLFFFENHIQGYVNSSIKIGLIYNGELVSAMSLGKKRKSLGSLDDGGLELYRHCNKINCIVIGGASKLFNAFTKENTYTNIITYSNNRLFSGNMYYNLGFKKIGETRPNYYYTRGNKRFNRFKFRKNTLIKEGADPSKTEKEIMIERGYSRIYDAGCGIFKIQGKV